MSFIALVFTGGLVLRDAAATQHSSDMAVLWALTAKAVEPQTHPRSHAAQIFRFFLNLDFQVFSAKQHVYF